MNNRLEFKEVAGGRFAMPTYKYAPLQSDLEERGGGGDSASGGAKSFDGDPFAKKRDLCVGL